MNQEKIRIYITFFVAAAHVVSNTASTKTDKNSSKLFIYVSLVDVVDHSICL